MKSIKTLIFIFYLLFTTHAFSKSYEYYQKTLVNLLTECNSNCQKQTLDKEIKYLFYEIFERILQKIKIELLEENKKKGKLS
jgi:hypothetical protein